MKGRQSRGYAAEHMRHTQAEHMRHTQAPAVHEERRSLWARGRKGAFPARFEDARPVPQPVGARVPLGWAHEGFAGAGAVGFALALALV